MKITDSEVIKNGEQDLIDAIIGELDWGTLDKIFREQHHLSIDEDVEYRGGDIVVHGNDIAYKLDFEAKVILSVLVDREGQCLSLTNSADLGKSGEDIDTESKDEKGHTVKPAAANRCDEGYEEAIGEICPVEPSGETDPVSPAGNPDESHERIHHVVSQAIHAMSDMSDTE